MYTFHILKHIKKGRQKSKKVSIIQYTEKWCKVPPIYHSTSSEKHHEGLRKFSHCSSQNAALVRGRQPAFSSTGWYSFCGWPVFCYLTCTWYTHANKYAHTQCLGLQTLQPPAKKALHRFLLREKSAKPDGNILKSTRSSSVETCCWSWAGLVYTL